LSPLRESSDRASWRAGIGSRASQGCEKKSRTCRLAGWEQRQHRAPGAGKRVGREQHPAGFELNPQVRDFICLLSGMVGHLCSDKGYLGTWLTLSYFIISPTGKLKI